MSSTTGIAWTDSTWNPVRGCSRVSEGCRNCYAERVASRYSAKGLPYHGFAEPGGGWTGRVELVPRMLDQPLRWKRRRLIFVDSMSDVFHESLDEDVIDQVFATMALAPDHTFQLLTKRPERMREYCSSLERRSESLTAWMDEARERMKWTTREEAFQVAPSGVACTFPAAFSWPLPNVWLGVSVENQNAADARVRLLLDTPAAIRFLSVEPMIGPVCLLDAWWHVEEDGRDRRARPIDWVIVGGESGPRARYCDLKWIRDVVAQCRAASVPVFVKQLGEVSVNSDEERGPWPVSPAQMIPWVDRKGGDWSEWPEDLRVREFPFRSEPAP